MRRIKTVLILLFTAVLLVGMALLPQWIAGVSDLLTNKKSGTAAIQTVELAFTSDRVNEPGYMMRKLALEQRMTTIPIELSQASMTEAEVIDAARNGMNAYMEANLFEWFEFTFCTAEPYLGVDPENKNNNSLFWGVTFTREDKPYHNLFLHIDDETGSILYLSYETDGPDKYKYYYPENQRLMMEGFVDAFLRPLNLTPGQLNEYKNFLGADAGEQMITDDVTYVIYTYTDAEYGTINIAFHISPEGLHVFYPEE